MNGVGGRYRIDRDDLLNRVDLRHVLDALTTGQGDGRHRRWRCPELDHPDLHPSATIATDRYGVERWRCWSGGHGGTAIDAVIAARHVTVGESIIWLNEHHAHVHPLPERDPSPTARDPGRPSFAVAEYVDRCEKMLWSKAGRRMRTWLADRGLTEDVLVLNRVGADPGRRFVPRERGFPVGNPAVVYPAFDSEGNVTYFQARTLVPSASRPKYSNPSRQHADNPGFAWTQPIGRSVDGHLTIVTEGIADALIAAGVGIRSVGVLGATTLSHALARRLAPQLVETCDPLDRIVLCFDADTPGRTGAERLRRDLSDHGVVTYVVELPDGLDLTDWAAMDADWADQISDRSASLLQDHLVGNEPTVEIEVDLGP